MTDDRSSARRLWWLMVTAGAIVLACFARYPERFRTLGVNHYGVWFLDTFAILASNDAQARGLDPYAANPLDYFSRAHGYPHWWLYLGPLGLTRGDYLWLGCALAAGFFVTAIVRLSPKSPGELLVTLAVLCSPPVLLALNRANNDLAVFMLLAPVVPCLLAGRPSIRMLAVPLIAAAALLKAYPAVAGIVLLAGTDARDVRLRLMVFAAVFAGVAIDLAWDLPRYAGIVPEPDGLMSFGALNLFKAAGASPMAARMFGLGAAAVIVAVFTRADPFGRWTVASAQAGAWLSFVLGAALLTACFLAGSSFAYRWIFAIWMVPLLWTLARDGFAPAAVRRLAGTTFVLLVWVVWSDALASIALAQFVKGRPAGTMTRWVNGFFLAGQPAVWALFTCLLGWLTHFVRTEWRNLISRAGPAEARFSP